MEIKRLEKSKSQLDYQINCLMKILETNNTKLEEYKHKVKSKDS